MNYPVTLQHKLTGRLATFLSQTEGYFLGNNAECKVPAYNPDSWQPVPEQLASRVYRHTSGAIVLRLPNDMGLVLDKAQTGWKVGDIIRAVNWEDVRYTPIDLAVELDDEFVPHLRRGKLTGRLALFTSPTERVLLDDGTTRGGQNIDDWEKVKIV